MVACRNVLRISTLSELEKEAASAKKVIEASKVLSPLLVRVIPVAYADVNEIAGQIKPFMTEARGKVAMDKRTNSIILKDVDDVRPINAQTFSLWGFYEEKVKS